MLRISTLPFNFPKIDIFAPNVVFLNIFCKKKFLTILGVRNYPHCPRNNATAVSLSDGLGHGLLSASRQSRVDGGMFDEAGSLDDVERGLADARQQYVTSSHLD